MSEKTELHMLFEQVTIAAGDRDWWLRWTSEAVQLGIATREVWGYRVEVASWRHRVALTPVPEEALRAAISQLVKEAAEGSKRVEDEARARRDELARLQRVAADAGVRL